ncbi:MAG: rhomboid family intramembrane serine protease [Deltaproteobacteria bacterium]|nr:rhomboid family intramembrane serine protease [Deltaproteobacteria bacterium]
MSEPDPKTPPPEVNGPIKGPTPIAPDEKTEAGKTADQSPKVEEGDDDDDTPPELLGPTTRRWGTISLILLNLAVGLVMAWAGVSVLMSSPGDIIAFGAVEPARLWSGEVWRLFTACFVHVGTWHLGLNLWVLWQVGRALERLVGTPRLVLIYVASGIFGFALSVALMPGLTAGASGAVFGVTGALLAIASLTRQRALGRFLLTSFVPFVVATFALGALLPMVNNVAHFGGLLMGFVLTYGLSAGDRSFADVDPVTKGAGAAVAISPREKQLGLAALIVSVLGFAVVTAYAVDPRWSPRFHAIMGLRALHTAQLAQPTAPPKVSEELTDAKAHAARAIELAPDDAATLLLSARLLEHEGKEDEAHAVAVAAFAGFQGSGERYAGFERAITELGLAEPEGHDDGEMPFSDGFTVRALCTAALDDVKVDTSKAPAPALKNACAWLLLRAHEQAIRDPARALPLAKEAYEESGKSEAAITHTYAAALAQNDAAAEGLALLERLVVTGESDGLDRGFLAAERERLQKLSEVQRRPGSAGHPHPGPGADDNVRPPAESR